MQEDIIIQSIGVQKTYRMGQVKIHALRGVDLTVGRGEMVAIMGQSGCGKTTLLNCLSGLDSIDQGDVLLEGASLPKMSDKERTAYRARRMGFVFQYYNLLPVMTAMENVRLPLLLSGLNASQARDRAQEALSVVGLGDWAGHRPAELSGGQRQRVAIARALVNQPAIVWADEPTGDLDTETADDVLSLMERLNRENGQTFVLVSHDRRVAERMGRVIRMRDGLIVDHNTASQSNIERGSGIG
jgi:putative ABC transport system ATP-binding protein